MASGPLLIIHNRHTDSCGAPPALIAHRERSDYYGYFENAYGEQWVFVYDRATATGTLRGGDIGWTRVYPVRDGRAPDLVLGEVEASWLAQCWQAATAHT